MTKLLRQWRAELAALGANLAHNERDAAAHASEAQSAEAALSRWWAKFQGAFQALERDQLDLTNTLLTPIAQRDR